MLRLPGTIRIEKRAHWPKLAIDSRLCRVVGETQKWVHARASKRSRRTVERRRNARNTV